MATDVSMVIAYRDFGCPHRRRALDYVRRFYYDLGWENIIQGGDATFTRASGINAGIRAVSGDVIVQCDPDSIVPHAKILRAVSMAADHDGMVIPHDEYRYLDITATEAIYAGADPFAAPAETTGKGVGNCVVFSRTTWELSGGFDERFGLWGGDDAAFAYACAAHCAPLRRLEGPVVHLWHPPHPHSNPSSRGYVDQFTLVAEYRDAMAAGPEAVREYVANR